MKKIEATQAAEITEVNEEENFKLTPQEELDLLKSKADLLGVKYRANISIEGLKDKILDKQEEDALKELEAQKQTVVPSGVPTTRQQIIAQQKAEQLRLVRVRISCMNPKKKEAGGEIVAVGNSLVGVQKKYIPYGSESNNGYHIPVIILNELRERKFDSSTYNQTTKQVDFSWKPEFSIEVLPDLTEKELAKLANAQIARDGLEE